MGLAQMFLFLYKHNPMCSIYTRYLQFFDHDGVIFFGFYQNGARLKKLQI